MRVQVGVLIGEINNIVAAGEFDRAKLTAASREVLDMLPHHTQQQLLLDRDPHGNVQVRVCSRVQTRLGFISSVGLVGLWHDLIMVFSRDQFGLLLRKHSLSDFELLRIP